MNTDTNNPDLFDKVLHNSGIGVTAGANVSADIEYYPRLDLDQVAGPFEYAGVDIGGGVQGSADVIMVDGQMVGGSLQFGLFGGAGATIHSGIGNCAIIPGTAGNIYYPFLSPDHSLDANGGSVAGSTPMMAGIQTPLAQQTSHNIQLNASGSSTASGSQSMSSRAVGAGGMATSFNLQQQTAPALSSSSITAGTTLMFPSGLAPTSGNKSASTATSTQTTGSSSTSFLSQVGSAISKAASSIGSFFSGLF